MPAAFLVVVASLVALVGRPVHAAGTADHSVRRLVSLVDYIGGDYPEAVAGGKVLNAEEYKEMRDFAAASITELAKLASSLPVDAHEEVLGNLTALKLLIEQKADGSAVRSLTLAVKNRVLDALAFDTTPQQTPDKSLAWTIYSQACASCHGANGGGDGPASQGMLPPPRNFHDRDVLAASSPFKYYNALVLGIEGTSMASFAQSLSDHERWSLAFYAMGISRSKPADDPEQIWLELPKATREALIQAGLSLELLARKSDTELRDWLKSLKPLAATSLDPTLVVLRTSAPYVKSLPRTAAVVLAAQTPQAPSNDLEQADVPAAIAALGDSLEKARLAFAAGQGHEADTILLDAYLNGFERFEAPLALRDKTLVRQVEQAFIAARQAAREGQRETFEEQLAGLASQLSRAGELLSLQADVSTGTGDFFASLVIIVREGFEAFLVIGAMLALLRRSGAERRAIRTVHAGWITAIAAGFATYYLFLAVFDLTGAARETVEAVCTGAAAIVLFYVSFWLLNQAERSKWDGFVRNFAGTAHSRSKLGLLFFVGFIAVYREAAETVLFYAALAASAQSMTAVALGFACGVSLLVGIVAGIIYWGVRIPMKRFFVMTSAAMIGLSIVLAGKAINELVEAGYIQPTRVNLIPTVDLLGIYPQWESLLVQGTAVIAAGLIAAIQVNMAKKHGRH